MLGQSEKTAIVIFYCYGHCVYVSEVISLFCAVYFYVELTYIPFGFLSHLYRSLHHPFYNLGNNNRNASVTDDLTQLQSAVKSRRTWLMWHELHVKENEKCCQQVAEAGSVRWPLLKFHSFPFSKAYKENLPPNCCWFSSFYSCSSIVIIALWGTSQERQNRNSRSLI